MGGKRYNHDKGLNYLKTFLGVVKSISYKCFSKEEFRYRYQIYPIDVIITFFYKCLDEIIYIEQLHLFVTKFDKFCKLFKDL